MNSNDSSQNKPERSQVAVDRPSLVRLSDEVRSKRLGVLVTHGLPRVGVGGRGPEELRRRVEGAADRWPARRGEAGKVGVDDLLARLWRGLTHGRQPTTIGGKRPKF